MIASRVARARPTSAPPRAPRRPRRCRSARSRGAPRAALRVGVVEQRRQVAAALVAAERAQQVDRGPAHRRIRRVLAVLDRRRAPAAPKLTSTSRSRRTARPLLLGASASASGSITAGPSAWQNAVIGRAPPSSSAWRMNSITCRISGPLAARSSAALALARERRCSVCRPRRRQRVEQLAAPARGRRPAPAARCRATAESSTRCPGVGPRPRWRSRSSSTC